LLLAGGHAPGMRQYLGSAGDAYLFAKRYLALLNESG
jgi:hypothetical protein